MVGVRSKLLTVVKAQAAYFSHSQYAGLVAIILSFRLFNTKTFFHQKFPFKKSANPRPQ